MSRNIVALRIRGLDPTTIVTAVVAGATPTSRRSTAANQVRQNSNDKWSQLT